MSDERLREHRIERAHERLEEHEQTHEQFDRRISRNENWRLQAQGALKILAIVVGSGVIGIGLDVVGII